MNDEQFEGLIDDLEADELSLTAARLRARDTAQRQELAQMEAERDTAIVQMQNIRTNRDRLNKQLGDTEFNLCIAQQQLAEAVGLLRKISAWPEEECTYGKARGPANSAQDFLARHALAEQQEAREETLDDILNSPCAPCEEEAQGAQAGEFQREDRYIVIKRKDLEAIERSGEASDLETHEAVRFLAEALDTLRPHLPARECLVIESDWPEYEPTWAAIQARVTGQGAQAADERDRFVENYKWRGWKELDSGSIERGAPECTVLAAIWQGWQARAALGTQPDLIDAVDVLEALADSYERGYRDGQSKPKTYSDKTAKHRVAAELLAAVRGAEHE